MAGAVDPKSSRALSLFTTEEAAAIDSLPLELVVTDHDTVEELHAYASGGQREQFALQALRIGVLALRQARGRVDADLIQRPAER